MIKLALIGKDIQHSRSPEIYQRLLVNKIQYDLLDYASPSSIPALEELFNVYNGISITSPYKKHFLDQILLTEQAAKLGAINCIKQGAEGFIGENTDYLAIVEITQKLKSKYSGLRAIVLGDGVMSNVVQVTLKELGIEFKLYARKTTADLDQINLTRVFDTEFKMSHQKIVINTCAREFVFKGEIDRQTIFWDFNYNFTPHSQILSGKTLLYMDGMEMLELQAIHALAFWSIKAI